MEPRIEEIDEETAAMFPGGDDAIKAPIVPEKDKGFYKSGPSPAPVVKEKRSLARKRGTISHANYKLLALVAGQRRRDPWAQLDVILENVLSSPDSPAYEPKR